MLLSLLASVAIAPISIYADPAGNDANSGTARAPFATLAKVQARLKELTSGSVVVHLHGDFFLAQPLVLGAEATNVKFVGPATISGALPLHFWQPATFNGRSMWAAKLPADLNFRELYIGAKSERAPRPHLPKTGFYAFTGYDPAAPGNGDFMNGQTTMKYRPGDLKPDWHNLTDVEIVAHHLWVTSRLPIASVESATNLVKFGKKSVFRLMDDYSTNYAPYVLENVAEALDTPGEWYLDRAARTVYYLPRPSDRTQGFVAYAPIHANILRLQGAKGTTFENLTFEHSEWNLPPDSAGDLQAANTVPGAIQIAEGEAITFHHCQIEHVGSYGLEIEGTAKNCRIQNSTIKDVGAGGVKIDDGSSGNIVSDCQIEKGGRLYASGIGVLIKLSGNNQIIHNRITDFYYTGISVGWDWGFRDTPAHDNLIAYNEISTIGQDQLSDMGGIYVLGKQPGSRIDHNRIRDVSARGYGGWGIYLDEGSTGWTVENNVVLHTKTGGFHIHYGGDNVIRNNVFAYALKEGQLIRQRDDKQGPIRFEHNLVVARPSDAPIVVGNWLKRAVTMTGMLYSAPKTDLPFGDDGTGRFIQTTLGPDGLPPPSSPIYQQGFTPIDLRTLGPRR